MSATTSPGTELLESTRQREHARCIVCGRAGPGALGLKFAVRPDGSVAAVFHGGQAFEGYDGLLHGGVIAAIADGAMTNCLFARGIAAVTGDLRVRYRRPVRADLPLEAAAWVTRSHGPLHALEAELTQAGATVVKASARFMETDGAVLP